MKQLSPLNWIVFAVGEIILILCFFMLLDGRIPENVFWLDLIISSVIYSLAYYRTVKPMVNLNDPAQREVSYLGLSFASIGIYSFTAIALMILMQYFDVLFKFQLLTQIILAFLLLLSFMVGTRMSEKTVEVFNSEQRQLNQLDKLRREMSHLSRTLACATDIPPQIKGRIADLSQQLRYIAPCNKLEAADLEAEMITALQRINGMCSDYEVNAAQISRTIAEAEHILKERKSITSI